MPETPDFEPKKVEQPIFNNELREKLVNPVRYQRTAELGGFKGFYKSNKIYFWAIGLGAIVIAVLAFLAFRKVPPPVLTEADVILEINAPETVGAGGEIVYKVKVENKDSQKLVDLQLELTYPSGVEYLSSSPKAQNLSGTLFNVPDLDPAQNTTIFVKARAGGSINDSKELLAKLRYKYSNFSSEFVKESSNTVRLIASDVLLELQGPKTANNAQLVIYNVKFRNDSDKDIENARISLKYPSGFEFASSNIDPDLGNNVWNIGTLSMGEEREIQIQGSFRSVIPGESKTAEAEFSIFGENGQFFTQSTSSFITQIGNLPLIATQELQSYNNSNVAAPGDRLDFTVKYQNNASVPAKGVNISVSLDSEALDLSTLRAEGGQISNGTILWNGATVSKLRYLSPNESGQLTYSVRVKNPATRSSSKNLEVKSNIKIKSDEYQGFFPGNALAIKISSPATIENFLDFVSGSLPPEVGRSTTYRIKLSLSNSTNDLNNLVLSAFVPLASGGFVEGSVNGSEASKTEFDSSTGKLTWRVGSLPAHAGEFTPARTLEFKVVLNPSSSDAHRTPTLVKDIKFEAKDSFTGEEVKVDVGDITTNDLSGENSYGKGTVKP